MPKNPLAGKHFNGTKAPKLPSSKKKKPRAAVTDDISNSPSTSNHGAGGGSGKAGGSSSHNRSKKSQRSILGFVVGTTACLAMWGWSIFQGLNKRKRDRRILDSMLRKPMHITEHGLCRMECRFVTRDHITETLQKGRINDRKSEPSQRPCPKYVVNAEVTTTGGGGGKVVQDVFDACRNETRVVTVIDTKNNWPCGPC